MPEKKPRRKPKTHATDRQHQIAMALIDVYKGPNGFDLMLLTGAAAGYGIESISDMLIKATESPPPVDPETGKPLTEEEKKDWKANAEKWLTGYATLIGGPTGYVGAKTIQALEGYFKSPGEDGTGGGFDNTLSGFMGGMFGVVKSKPGTFADLCMMLLFTRAIFGTGGMGEILKGIGEIIPL